MTELKGIDVSTHQGDIDWKRVRASGVDFAMIKATQGRGEGVETRGYRKFRDPRFVSNITEADKNGIACGVYHYFTAKNPIEAREEAAYFLATIAPHKDKIKLWAAVDVESEPWLSDVDKPMLTDAVREFMVQIRNAGYKPMLYTNPDFLCYRYLPGAFNDAEIWLAHHMLPTGTPMKVPNMQMWQYGSVGTAEDVKKGNATIASGRIPGINAGCDVNEGYFELPSVSVEKPVYVVGNLYRIKAGDRYTSGLAVPSRLVGECYPIVQVKPGRILLGNGLNSWVEV